VQNGFTSVLREQFAFELIKKGLKVFGILKKKGLHGPIVWF